MIQDLTSQNKSAIGVYLGGKVLKVGRVKKNVVEASLTLRIDNNAEEEVVLKQIFDAIDQVFTSDVGGIGIGVPSLVDVDRGVVYDVEYIPSWKEVHLKDLLFEKYKVNIYVNNDANCFVIGEKYFGKATNYRNVVGVIAGVGLGCGVVTNNNLYSGANCGAGEIGCISYRDHNYEYYCTTKYFQTKYGLKADALLTRAKKKDKIALAILEQFGLDFAQAVKTILYVYDPECIVVGGDLTDFFPYFEKFVWKSLRKFPYSKTIDKLKLEVSEEPNIAVLGAAALYYDDLQ
ncbi:ROK family protein [Flammeovirga aprica]|uniref:ROK family protein n=1 Tax=Flammeovirga aprica JL-4 TaxID=694437 RepID=A0A7X9XAU9_9BACT|nr:ROK family protein [Flammeovirga aprica]NME70060.1 ROK family protein [Flammeovirga aprica JL-4]